MDEDEKWADDVLDDAGTNSCAISSSLLTRHLLCVCVCVCVVWNVKDSDFEIKPVEMPPMRTAEQEELDALDGSRGAGDEPVEFKAKTSKKARSSRKTNPTRDINE